MRKNKNNRLFFLTLLLLSGGGLLFWFFKSKKSDKILDDSKISGGGESSPSPSPSGDLNIIRNTGSWNNESYKSLYAEINKVLNDYSFYCEKVKWKFNFIKNDNTIKNIMVHFIIETGNGVYLHDNNFGNITEGGWKNNPYSCSPYIKDFYGHSYLGVRSRSDRGVKDDIQNFRVYEYSVDGIIDYLDLINRGKRYKGIPTLYSYKDPVFIKELGLAGYYTADPVKIYSNAKTIRESLESL